MIDGTESGLEPREAHRALFIIEILMQVLRHLGKPELAATALVCCTWTDVALDMLWEEMESIHPIMALLGPIRRHYNGWNWDSGFPSGDWARYASYAKRVRSLSYRTTSEGQEEIPNRVYFNVPTRWLDYMASHHGRYLLPEIRKIDWDCCDDDQLEMILPFLSSKVEEVRISTRWEVMPSAMDRLLRALRSVLPFGVRVFHSIPHGEKPEEGVLESTGLLLESLHGLQELRLPFHRMAPFMFKPSHLRVLEADCDLESGINITDLLSQLADACSLLEHLRVMFWKGSNINFSIIRPLLRCSRLKNLDLEYRGSLDLTTKDIQEMGNAWRELEVLNIASRRVYDDPVDPALGMPLGSLVAFAKFFSPKLRKLGLYISTQDIPAPPDPPVSLPNLEVLHLRTSEFDSEKTKVVKAFAFLSALLPKGAGIITSDRWVWEPERSVFDPGNWGRGYRYASWGILSRMLAQGETADTLAGLDPATPLEGYD